MRFRSGLLITGCGLVTAVLLSGCPKKETDDNKNALVQSATVTPSAAPTPSITELQHEDSSSIVKAELDNRSDGITGTPVAIPGAKAVFQSPQGWQTAKGDVQTMTAADQKARLAAASYGAEGSAGKLDKVSTAAGLTECKWNPPESVTVGKDKLIAQAADGNCKRGAGQVKAAQMATEGLLVVGSWDDGGDRNNVFGAMRSVAKAAGGGGSNEIAKCCAAIKQNAASAPPQQVPYYMTALAACNGLQNNPQGRAALGGVRSALGPAAVPAACK